MTTTSWVICNKLTGKAVFETFNKNTADAFRDPRSSFRAVPVMEYLQSINDAAYAVLTLQGDLVSVTAEDWAQTTSYHHRRATNLEHIATMDARS